jgi:hypothetical protein
VEGLQIVLVVAAVLVLVGLLAAVPLVTGRRRRQDAGEVRQADLGREPGAGGGPGQPPRSGRGADVDLPDDRGVAPAAPPPPPQGKPPTRSSPPAAASASASAVPGPPCPAAWPAC